MSKKSDQKGDSSRDANPGDNVQELVRSDTRELNEWVKEFGTGQLISLCDSIVAVYRANPAGDKAACSRILQSVLPTGAARIMRQMLQKPSGRFAKSAASLASKELTSCLQDISVRHAPWVIAMGSGDESPQQWKSLECSLAEDEDGDTQLNLEFRRNDGASFFVHGSPDTAIGQVLPRIMNTIVRGKTLDADDDDIRAFQSAVRKLEKWIRKARTLKQVKSNGSEVVSKRSRGREE